MLSQLLAMQAERENQFNQIITIAATVDKLAETLRLARVDLDNMKAKVEADLRDAEYAAIEWRKIVDEFEKPNPTT